jgi:ribosomal protein S27E
MTAPCVEPLPLYRPRNPQASDLWRLLDQHFETFQQVYDERFAAKYGFWRPIVERSLTAFLKCGDLHEGFARIRCPDCHHEMFVAFSCKQRCTCPSCHQKRALLTAIHVAEDVCAPVAHRQVVLTIPNSLVKKHGRLVGRQRRAVSRSRPDTLVTCDQLRRPGQRRERDVLRLRFFPSRDSRRSRVRGCNWTPNLSATSLANSFAERAGDCSRRATTKARIASVHLWAPLGPRLRGTATAPRGQV